MASPSPSPAASVPVAPRVKRKYEKWPPTQPHELERLWELLYRGQRYSKKEAAAKLGRPFEWSRLWCKRLGWKTDRKALARVRARAAIKKAMVVVQRREAARRKRREYARQAFEQGLSKVRGLIAEQDIDI